MADEVYDLGLRIKRLREEMNLTQEDLAKRLDVKVLSVKRYESNEQQPPIDKLEKMALLFRVSIDYLMNLDKRKSVYIDDLSQGRQKLVLDVIDLMRNEQKYN